MISLARCLVYPNYKLSSILKAILKDEITFWIKKKNEDSAAAKDDGTPPAEVDADTVIRMVSKSVNQIMGRLQSLSAFDGTESKVCEIDSLNTINE